MFRFSRALIAPAAAVVWLAGSNLMSVTAARAEIVLNEILADPARDWNADGTISSRDDEWAEIHNPGPVAVNLAGYRLAGPDSVWRYAFSGTLAPNQVTVVYGRQSYDWETANGFPAFGLRLSNTGGELCLFKVAGDVVTKIDSYTYKDHEADDDRSSGRGPDGAPNWILLDGWFPWTGTALPHGTGCFPSPGTLMNCATPVEPVTWGMIKALMER